jgi:peroxiredoxin
VRVPGGGVAGAALLAAALSSVGAAPGPSPGSPAPDFQLEDPAGKSVRLSSLRGEVVILHFWATWCPHCANEMPLLESLGRDTSFKGVRILAVNLGEPSRRVVQYLRDHSLSLEVLLDSRGTVAESYGVLGLPASVVVDASGKVVRGISMGSLDREALEKILAPLRREQAEKAPPP